MLFGAGCLSLPPCQATVGTHWCSAELWHVVLRSHRLAGSPISSCDAGGRSRPWQLGRSSWHHCWLSASRRRQVFAAAWMAQASQRDFSDAQANLMEERRNHKQQSKGREPPVKSSPVQCAFWSAVGPFRVASEPPLPSLSEWVDW